MYSNQIKPEKEKPETGNDLLFYDRYLFQADCIIINFTLHQWKASRFTLYRNIYEQLFGEIDKYYTHLSCKWKKNLQDKKFQDVLPEHNEVKHRHRFLRKMHRILFGQPKKLKELDIMVNLNLGCHQNSGSKTKGSGFLRASSR